MDRCIAAFYILLGLVGTVPALYLLTVAGFAGAVAVAGVADGQLEYALYVPPALLVSAALAVGYVLQALYVVVLWRGNARPALWFATATYTAAWGVALSALLAASGGAPAVLAVYAALLAPALVRALWTPRSA